MAAAHAMAPAAPAPKHVPPPLWGERVGVWWRGLLTGLALPAGGSALPRRMPAGLLAALLIVILVGVLTTGVVVTSAHALPGDLLYPVKTAVENVQVLMARAPEARDAVLAEQADRRVEEAKAIVKLGRPVSSLALEGTIERINGSLWSVSGLTVTITSDTRIEGNPVLGARVEGRMRAPGDGRLVVLNVEIEPPSAGRTLAVPAAIATTTATSSPTRMPPTVTPTATPESRSGGARRVPTQRVVEPVEPPTNTPTSIPTATPTRTRRPTATATITVLPTPSPTLTREPPRPVTHTWIRGGWVQAIQGSSWTVSGRTFRTDGNTRIDPGVEVGWKVDVELRVEADGSLVAEQIIGISGPEATPEPYDFTDKLNAMEGEWWIIGSTRVRIWQETQIEGDPKIDDLVSVKAQHRSGGEIWALRITVVHGEDVQFQGFIDAVNSDSLVVNGQLVFIDGQTKITGQPAVGRFAEVAAVRMPDGRVIARVIVVREPTPTRTPTSTVSPTSNVAVTPTPTLEPTATPTPEPTATPTPEPTATQTPEPTATATLEPTMTMTPEQVADAAETPTPTEVPAP
jgi:hypothetical protein